MHDVTKYGDLYRARDVTTQLLLLLLLFYWLLAVTLAIQL